jgi:predicted patatin/cPLA2 family phospholipase
MKKEYIAINISGAGFAIPSIAGAIYELINNNIKPNVISGVSSGAILTLILACSKNPKKVIQDNVNNFTTKDVFKYPPFNKKGNLTIPAIFNGITKNYLAKQNRLPDLLKKLVPESDFLDYKNNPKSPDAIILSVDLITGKRIFTNLKELNYESAILHVQASCSIPVFSNGIKHNNMYLFDGGIRNHILSEWISDIYPITTSYSIFSRAEHFDKETKENNLRTLPQILLRTIQIMENEISKSDEELQNIKSKLLNIKNINIFIPNILNNVYDDSKDKQIQLFQQGIQITKNKLSETI